MAGNLVAVRKAMLAWQAAKKQVRADVAELVGKITADIPDGAGEFKKIAAAVDHLDFFDDKLDDALNDLVNAPEAKQAPAKKKVETLAKQYQAHLNQNKLLPHLENNPWTKLALRANLTKALTGLLKELGG